MLWTHLKVFNAPSTTSHGRDVWNISFIDEPVLATSLRIRPYTWAQRGPPCMRIELYGCLLNNSESYDNVSNILALCVCIPLHHSYHIWVCTQLINYYWIHNACTHSCIGIGQEFPSGVTTGETVASDTDTDLNGECYIRLIGVGIGGAIVGSLITIAIVLVVAVIFCCCRYIRKRRFLIMR